ncbi:hypothetical protein DRE_06498 [Drechslerella stenobrocha 248]|uniref:ATP-dependent RNA helicase n=1 Tax=Drechslerella stenobrocha 248 TaxID=1043628 RepID=W7I6Z4_9PEZI|nr:hypothetical protein DRE_06498 [Drechslerella stenobrocha 248]
MLRLNSRLPGKQATSPTAYICQRCFHSSRWSSPSVLSPKPGSYRSYHATTASLDRMQQPYRPGPASRFRMDNGDENAAPYRPRNPYGKPNAYRQRRRDYLEDEEHSSREFDPSRYRAGAPPGLDEAGPDIRTMMANSRASDFARRLHKLRRDELERRDPAVQILSRLQQPNSFEESSLRPVMKKALAKAFPNVKYLSPTQKNLLVLLQEGYSVCATGPPGSGKSFIVTLWLLQMMRSIKSTIMPNGKFRKTPITTAIIFVPHIDLLFQYMHLLTTLYEAFGEPGQAMPPRETIFQGFTRYGKENSAMQSEQISTLEKFPSPHIILTTPNRLLDILNDPDAKNLIDLTSLKVIAADEVDAMTNQRPVSKSLSDMTTKSKRRREMRWGQPTPLEVSIDFILARREMRADQRGETPEPIQFCCISPNLSPVLKSKLTYQKKWVGASDSESNANTLLNLGIQDFSQLFDHEKIDPIVSLPGRIKHHALSVDITSGMMRDIPPYQQDALIRSRDEQAEIQKYVGILKSHKDPRAASMSREALAVEAAQEGILLEEEGSMVQYTYTTGTDHPEFAVHDITTHLPNDFRHTGLPRNIAVEVLDVLLKRENYPERVIMYLSPIAARATFISALREIGFKAEQVRMETCAESGISLGRSDVQLPPAEPKTTPRTRADTTIWVASSVGLRGIDTPHFTHAYIMVPTTGYQKYTQMAGRIARYPFTKQMFGMPEPTGKVTTIFLEEPVGKAEHAPFIDGVIQVDSPVEGLAWRRIHRMYGLCGAKVEPYFGPNEENGVMLRSPQRQLAMFPEMDDEVPWEHEMGEPGTDAASKGFEFLPESKETVEVPGGIDGIASAVEAAVGNRRTEQPQTPEPDAAAIRAELEASISSIDSTADDVVQSSETPVQFNDSQPSQTNGGSPDDGQAPIDEIVQPVSEGASDPDSTVETTAKSSEAPETEDSAAAVAEETQEVEEAEEVEKVEGGELEEAIDGNDSGDAQSAYQPVELQDGPHFVPEDAEVPPVDPTSTESAPADSTLPIDPQIPTDVPLEIAEGVTEEEAREFQEAQDQIFSAFMELNILQEKIRKAREGSESAATSESEAPEQAVESSGATTEGSEVSDEATDSSLDHTLAVEDKPPAEKM